MSGSRPSHEPRPHPPAQPDWHDRRLWQIQPVRDLLIIAAVIGLVYLGYLLSIVTVPLLLAMTIAYLVEPIVGRLTRISWISRQGAAAGIILVAALVVVAPLVFGTGFALVQGVALARSVAGNVQALQRSVAAPDDRDALDQVPEGAWRWLRDGMVDVQKRAEAERAAGQRPPAIDAEPATEPREPSPVREELDEAAMALSEFATWVFARLHENAAAISLALGRGAIGTGADAVRAALATVASLGFVIFTAFLTAFFFFFLCTGYGRVLGFWRSLIPERRKHRVLDLLGQMDRVIAGFIRGRLMICACLMVYYTISYWLIGVPAPLILGPLIGAFSLVPYLSGLGAPVSMLLLWIDGSGHGWQAAWWWIVFAPIGVSILSQVLDDYILSPAIQGRATNMDTPTILFASIAGGALMGVYGLLLAIPAAACLKILLREIVWPRFRDWAEGRTRDPLPISPGDPPG